MLSLPATLREVNAADVIVFEALSQRFPKVRDCVHRHPTDFTGGHSFRGDAEFDADEFDWTDRAALDSERNSDKPLWAKHLPQQEPDYTLATKVCAFLFPEGAGKSDRIPEDNLHIADPHRLARYFLMTSLESVPEASDIHEKLSKRQALGEALATGEPSELVLLLEWICYYLPSCQTLDVDGSANALIARALRSESEHDLTTDLAELFAKALERLIRKAPAEKRESSFLQIIVGAPLSISEKVLLEAAIEQGKWSLHPELIKVPKDQLISNSDLVDEAIATWSENVRRCVDAGALSKEPRMHSILHRFAQLNYTYRETYEAVGKICATENGLRKFLSTHVKDSPFDSLDLYALVEDAHLLASRIRASELRAEYSWLADHIAMHDRAKAIGEQSTRLKETNRSRRV